MHKTQTVDLFNSSQSIGETVSAMVTGIVRDSNPVNRTIIKGTVEDGVVFVVSNAEFTIDSTDPNNVITGFDVIRQGVTLRNTTAAYNGVTATAPDSLVLQQTQKS